jgi:hypothetical protein
LKICIIWLEIFLKFFFEIIETFKNDKLFQNGFSFFQQFPSIFPTFFRSDSKSLFTDLNEKKIEKKFSKNGLPLLPYDTVPKIQVNCEYDF